MCNWLFALILLGNVDAHFSCARALSYAAGPTSWWHFCTTFSGIRWFLWKAGGSRKAVSVGYVEETNGEKILPHDRTVALSLRRRWHVRFPSCSSYSCPLSENCHSPTHWYYLAETLVLRGCYCAFFITEQQCLVCFVRAAVCMRHWVSVIVDRLMSLSSFVALRYRHSG